MARFNLTLAAGAALLALAAAAAYTNPEDRLLNSIGVQHEGVRRGLKQAREQGEYAYQYLSDAVHQLTGKPAAPATLEADKAANDAAYNAQKVANAAKDAASEAVDAVAGDGSL